MWQIDHQKAPFSTLVCIHSLCNVTVFLALEQVVLVPCFGRENVLEMMFSRDLQRSFMLLFSPMNRSMLAWLACWLLVPLLPHLPASRSPDLGRRPSQTSQPQPSWPFHCRRTHGFSHRDSFWPSTAELPGGPICAWPIINYGCFKSVCFDFAAIENGYVDIVVLCGGKSPIQIVYPRRTVIILKHQTVLDLRSARVKHFPHP